MEKGSGLFDAVKDKLPFINQMQEHPDYDAFWQKRNAAASLVKENVPGGKFPAFLVVAGFYDAEDCYGPFLIQRYFCVPARGITALGRSLGTETSAMYGFPLGQPNTSVSRWNSPSLSTT